MIFQYSCEPVLILRILISFDAIQKNELIFIYFIVLQTAVSNKYEKTYKLKFTRFLNNKIPPFL